jgi:hypothetical protein
MPLALEPGSKHKIWLDIDADKPFETRPMFLIKAQTMRTQVALGTAVDEFYDSVQSFNSQTAMDRICEMLSTCIVGWENIEIDGESIPFQIDLIQDILNSHEGLELINKVLAYNKLSVDEKKSSELPV